MKTDHTLKTAALRYHAADRPGKTEIRPTKPHRTQRDLALAYSPGVAYPCLEIAAHPEAAYDYTNKGNLVAVVTNGTAVLGLGAIGAAAAKPVMEGKAMLFKTFAGIDAFDIELDTTDPDEFVRIVSRMAPSFGAVNLEDIKAPECFEIERRLCETLDIPVMHDDQHGTAVITAAALLNALFLNGKRIEETTVVVSGAGAAAIASARLFLRLGIRRTNLVMCDSRGVVTAGRGGLPRSKGPTCSWAYRKPICSPPRWSGRWPPGRWSWRWPTPTPRSPMRRHAPRGPTSCWRRDVRTTPTRSTTSWAFPTSSAERSTCAPPGSTTR